MGSTSAHSWTGRRSLIVAGFAALLATGAFAATPDQSRAEEQARRFLDRLKVPMERPVPSYKPLLAVSPDEIMGSLDAEGVVVWTAQANGETTYKPRTVESQLEKRKGTFYSRLSHLGQTASIPQYSTVTFAHPAADKMVATLKYGYELTFLKRSGRYVLSRIKYSVKDGE